MTDPLPEYTMQHIQLGWLLWRLTGELPTLTEIDALLQEDAGEEVLTLYTILGRL